MVSGKGAVWRFGPCNSPLRPLSVTGAQKSASEVARALVNRKGTSVEKAAHASGTVLPGGASRIISAGQAAVVVNHPVARIPPFGAPIQEDDAAADDIGGSDLDIEGEAVGGGEASADAAGISEDEDFRGRFGIKGTGVPASKPKGTNRRRAQFEHGERWARAAGRAPNTRRYNLET